LWAVEGAFREVVHRVPAVMGQTPFYYAFVWASIRMLGESEPVLRLTSLLSVAGATAAVGFVGRSLAGWRGAIWSAGLFWICYPAIWASIDARPYSLAFCCAALAALGFVRACQTGGRTGRLLWIVGAAGLVWTHYIFVPFLLAFPAMHAIRPGLRRHYSTRQIVTDAGLIGLLLVPALPQLLSIVRSPESQQWIFQGSPLAVIGLFVPFSVAAWFSTPRAPRDETRRDLRAALWLAVCLQFAAIAAAGLVGINLMEPRYAGVIVVAAAVLAGDNLARLRGTDLVAPLTVYVAVTALTLAANAQVTGSMSGAGFQEWREAVAALRPELARTPRAPVLFRSGNAEDDRGQPGWRNWPATLAPLRSPGQIAPAWNIDLLTYRWNLPGRSEYFENTLAARIADEPVFYLLCQFSAERGANGYCGNVVAWIGEKWPGRFRAVSLGRFRFLTVLRFERTPQTPSIPSQHGR
jgi:hypothetical protein